MDRKQLIRKLNSDIEPRAPIQKRRHMLARALTKAPRAFDTLSLQLGLGWLTLALGRPAEALKIIEPAFEVTGRDDQGNLVEHLGVGALLLAALIHDQRKRPEDAAALRKRTLGRETGQRPNLDELRGAIERSPSESLDVAIDSVGQALCDALILGNQDDDLAGKIEHVIAEGLDTLRARFGAGKKKGPGQSPKKSAMVPSLALKWKARGLSDSLRQQAGAEPLPIVAQLLELLADRFDEHKLHRPPSLDLLHDFAGCLLVLGRDGDALAAAEILVSRQAYSTGWGPTYRSHGSAIQWFVLQRGGDAKGAQAAKRREGGGTFGTFNPKEIERHWRETVTRVDKSAKELMAKDQPFLEDVLNAGSVLINLVSIEFGATDRQATRARKIRERKLVPLLQSWLQGECRLEPEPQPVAPQDGARKQKDPLPRAYSPEGEAHPFIRRYKEVQLKKVSFRSTTNLITQLNLAWCLIALGRETEALSIVDTIAERVDFSLHQGYPEEWGYAYDAMVMGVWLRKQMGQSDGIVQRLEMLRSAPKGYYELPTPSTIEHAEERLQEARGERQTQRKFNLLHCYVLIRAAICQIDDRSKVEVKSASRLVEDALAMLRQHLG